MSIKPMIERYHYQVPLERLEKLIITDNPNSGNPINTVRIAQGSRGYYLYARVRDDKGNLYILPDNLLPVWSITSFLEPEQVYIIGGGKRIDASTSIPVQGNVVILYIGRLKRQRFEETVIREAPLLPIIMEVTVELTGPGGPEMLRQSIRIETYQ
jgi:hypothetical protein